MVDEHGLNPDREWAVKLRCGFCGPLTVVVQSWADVQTTSWHVLKSRKTVGGGRVFWVDKCQVQRG